MATERITERSDGVTAERTVERGGETTVVERSGGGMGTALVALAVIAVLAIVAFFVIQSNRQGEIQTAAISDAASSVGNAAENVGDAAQDAAKSVTPSN
jgi:hypothetical protein